jgi:hypothetical protein
MAVHHYRVVGHARTIATVKAMQTTAYTPRMRGFTQRRCPAFSGIPGSGGDDSSMTVMLARPTDTRQAFAVPAVRIDQRLIIVGGVGDPVPGGNALSQRVL